MEIIFEKVNIFQIGKDRIFLKSYSSIESLWLGNFLLEIGDRWVESFKEWALNPQETYNSSNETYQEKENGYIYICDLFIDDPRSGPCYEISIANFIDLLDQWEKALATKPDSITITKEDNKLIVKTEHIQLPS